MARIDELPPDQRAALQLLLKQGRSYEEIAQLLRIEPSAVRERARAALDTLGPDDVDGLSLERQDEVADYLLGQQSASLRASTRAFLEESAPGRAWARVVAGELRPMAGENLPEIPAEAAEVDEAFDALNARTAHRERTEKSSRVGGAILLVGLALALLLAILLITGAFSGDDDGGGNGNASTSTTGTQTQAGEPQVEAQINLQKPQGQSGNAAGVAQVARQGGQRAVALVAQGLPRATENRFYAIWLYTSPEKAKFLGFPNPQPDQNGRIETGFGLPNDANQFDALVVTRETEERPRRPGTVVLRGALDLPG
jgi:Anti-sigma-K factor rskA/Sigma-70, region 4